MKNMKIFVLSVVGVLLLCSVASAVEVTPFFKIACEYAANPFKAEKEWIGKEVCIEGKIYIIMMLRFVLTKKIQILKRM